LYDLIVEKPTPDLPSKYSKYLNPIYRKMMKKSPTQRSSASDLLKEEVFVSLMREYMKKKKIDSLDLKYIVPKRLAIHNTKETHKK
jgi:serine/threonine protein kinase